MLTIPSYIERAAVVGTAIKHKWNDEDPDTFYTESDRIESRIARTTIAGGLALALGCLEWVAWRMSTHSNVAVLLQAIEAMWAGMIDARYVSSLYDSPLALLRKDWKGPAKGPVYRAYWQLSHIQDPLEAKEPVSPEASTTVRLARFVLPNTKSFDTWWMFVLKRLVDAHPQSEEGEDDIGKPIPREALDPEFDYKPSDAQRFISAFLAKLDPKSNAFLASPREMKKAGFKGQPYHF